MHWRKKWQSTPVFLPGKSCGQRSLVGYSPWDHKEVDTTGWLTLSLQDILKWQTICSVGSSWAPAHGLAKALDTTKRPSTHQNYYCFLFLRLFIYQPPSFLISFMGNLSTLLVFFSFLLPHHAACGISVSWWDQTHTPCTGSAVLTAEPQGKSLLKF